MNALQIEEAKRFPKTCRIWITRPGANDGDYSPVRITLHDETPLALWEGGPTDEGFSHSGEIYTYSAAQHCVTVEYVEHSQDCDGRFDSERIFDWQLGGPTEPWHDWSNSDPETGDPTPRPEYQLPDWQRVNSWQRDHSAESAGY